MRNVLTAWMVLALLLSITASAQNTNPGSGGMKKIEPLPRDLEIQLVPRVVAFYEIQGRHSLSNLFR